MGPLYSILWKALVKPFYRENAGLFVFVFTMMFFIVNKVGGAELLEYHYSLILGTLKKRRLAGTGYGRMAVIYQEMPCLYNYCHT